ncbi:HTH domain protein [Natrialba magadii ATCC 43099]|nr:transcriptional regulator [Natrialba magadii]ADD03753.2 HTH domain protein [Natrialba magadii ATCC 43099]
MRPDTETVSSRGETVGPSNGFDAWKALQKATDKKRADIIADIVGHPKGAPSVEELTYMNPRLSDDAIRRHLKTLADVGVVQLLEFEPGERTGGFPYQFFELSAEARALFDQNGLFPEEAWTRQWQSVEKTPRIRDIEAMPRPSPGDE